MTLLLHALLAGALLSAACGGGARQVSQSGRGAYQASLAPTADGFVVAWSDTRHGDADIYLRLLNAQGEAAAPERRLTTDPPLSSDADIQVAGSNMVIAWHDKDPEGKLQAQLGLWSQDGRPLWSHRISSEKRNGRNPIVRMQGTELLAVWLEDADADGSEVWAGWWNLAGDAVVAPRRLAPAGRTTVNLSAGIGGDGLAWIVFDAKAGTRSEELFLVRAGQSGSELTLLTADDGVPSKDPDVAFSRDRAAVAWYDARDGNREVYLFVGRFSGFAEERALRVTDTPGHSIGALVAWNGNRVGLAWTDDSDGQHEVYFQPFDAEGAPLADASQLTNNDSSSLVPSITPAGNGFALAWHEEVASPAGAEAAAGRSEVAFTIVP